MDEIAVVGRVRAKLPVILVGAIFSRGAESWRDPHLSWDCSRARGNRAAHNPRGQSPWIGSYSLR
ncbi:MAG: hypothetical protein ACREIR_14640, partial [Geminicoccaceae bacterium]